MGPTTFSSSGTETLSYSNKGEFEQVAVSIQQQIIVHTVINKLTDMCFERCMGKSNRLGESLGGKDVACVHSTVMKWLDTNEFMIGSMARRAVLILEELFGKFLHV